MLAACDALIPVPLHRWRFLKRRYNQSALLAAALGRAVNKPVYLDALVRTRATPPQGHKRARDRAKNVKNAFAVHPRHCKAKILDGRRIVLVDDVFTTGATARECAKTLLGAGAAQVDVLAIARVKRD
jgi:ComF family protein